MNKRLISAIVAVAMTVSLIPVSFAEKTNDDIQIESEKIVFNELNTNDEILNEYIENEQDFESTEDDKYEDYEIAEEASIQLMANTGTYYDEWGIWFDTETGMITKCDNNQKEIILPKEIDGCAVIAIGYQAFNNCTTLESIIIPSTVNSTGSYLDYNKYVYGNWFNGCTNLKTIYIEEGAEKIPNFAFENTPAVETINLPNSVTYIGYRAFANCKKLSHIDIPGSLTSTGSYLDYNKYVYGNCFVGCEDLKTVIIENGVESIPLNFFANITSLETVIMPNTVTEIGRYAFENCINLKKINLSNSLNLIGYKAFSNCSSLEQITLPASLTSTGSYLDYNKYVYGNWFNGCTNLKTIYIEEGAEKIPNFAFENTPAVETINLPNSVTYIGYRAFANCKKLSHIDIPGSLTSTGSYVDYNKYVYGNCFAGCENLKSIALEEGTTTIPQQFYANITNNVCISAPDNLMNISTNAFSNSTYITLMCSEYSYIIKYAVDNDINFHITKEITSYENFVFNGTDYITDYSDVSSSGIVNLEVSYKFKDSVKNKVKNPSVVIRLPKTVSIVNGTIKVNGVPYTEYTQNNNLVTIPVTELSGTISICVEPTEQGRILSYALMSYTLDGVKKQDTIGVINQDIPLLTVKSDDVTSKANITVSGIAVPNKQVEIYCNDTKLGETTALKSGKYQTSVTIPSPANYKKYAVKAISKDTSDNEITAETTVTYLEGAPNLTAFDMYYNGVKYDLFSADNVKPTITFVPGKPFSYRVRFDNVQNVDTVYIVSNRNNSVKKLKAEYDAANGYYVANGYFDENNHSYVPGVVSVEYIEKNEPYLFSKDIDFTEDKYVNTLPEEWENAVVTLNDESGEPVAEVQLMSIAEDDIKGIIELKKDIKAKLDFNLLSDKIPSYINKDNASEYGYEKVTDDAGEELYIKMAEYADDKIQTEVISFAKGKLVNFLLENKYYGAESALESIGTLSSALGTVDKLITYNQNRVDINEARQEVINSERTSEEKKAALAHLDNAQKANNGLAAIMIVSTCLALSGVSLPFAGGLILAGLSYQNSNYVKNALGDWSSLASRQSTGTNLTFRWKIDPSGYVYEAVTTNRLESVTATAYWKEDEDSTAELWDATEWQQANPLITDINGMYAWDVPEGLWQVKYEKDGYETQLSDWLPVPPPQTDVNIGLVSKSVPKVETVVLNSNSLTVTFDKYMKPETVNNVSIGNYTYTIDYNKNETAPDGTVYAKTYIFKLNEPVADGENITVSISNAESYANVKMAYYSENVVCSNATPQAEYAVKIENAVEDKTNGKITADFTNLTEKIQSFDAICAVYDENGTLIGVQSYPVFALDGNETEGKTFSFDKAWASYKMFAWDSFEGMKPITE